MNKLQNILEGLNRKVISDGYPVVFCPTCKRGYLLAEEKEMIKQVGECASCDHLRTDLSIEELHDYAQEEVCLKN